MVSIIYAASARHGVIKKLVKQVQGFSLRVAVFLSVVGASSYSSVASNNRHIWEITFAGGYLHVLIARIFKARRSSCILRKQKAEVADVGNGHTSTCQAGTTNGRQLQNYRTQLRHASVALQPAILAVTSVMTQFFMLMVTGLMSHIKFFNPDSVSGSACSPVVKSAVHPNYVNCLPLGQSVKAENIKRSSSGMLTLKRIGIVYGTAV
ncbi:MAG: hypothetical protein EZS28_018857 [Streblomastix strix]|uniref:Uncharacterized protein n=1 Tax=Streblomastix strix TaxID=222440 RepID=A0A5J4VTX1_9EUKA|nr:MAG: hypothetical protein EZS28_018857 [Streblomastix strix]